MTIHQGAFSWDGSSHGSGCACKGDDDALEVHDWFVFRSDLKTRRMVKSMGCLKKYLVYGRGILLKMMTVRDGIGSKTSRRQLRKTLYLCALVDDHVASTLAYRVQWYSTQQYSGSFQLGWAMMPSMTTIISREPSAECPHTTPYDEFIGARLCQRPTTFHHG